VALGGLIWFWNGGPRLYQELIYNHLQLFYIWHPIHANILTRDITIRNQSRLFNILIRDITMFLNTIIIRAFMSLKYCLTCGKSIRFLRYLIIAPQGIQCENPFIFIWNLSHFLFVLLGADTKQYMEPIKHGLFSICSIRRR